MAIITLLFFMLLHFKIIGLGFVSLTSGFFFFSFILLKHINKIRFDKVWISISLIALFLPIINVYQVIGQPDYAGLVEFIKSYLYWSAFVLFFHVLSVSNINLTLGAGVVKGGGWSLWFLVIFSILQFCSAKLGFFELYELFSERLLNYENSWWLRNSNWIMSGQLPIKSPGIYYEPSFLGIVILTLIASQLIIGHKDRLVLLLGAVMTIVIGSASYTLGFFILTTVYAIYKFSPSSRVVSGIILSVLCFVGSFIFLSERFAELMVEGSSGYYRFIVPFEMLKYVLEFYPFGLVLGGGDELIQYLSFWQEYAEGQTEQLTIDNGLFLVLINFGFLSILILPYMYFILTQCAFFGRNKEVHHTLFCILILYIFATTGAVFSFELISLIGYLVLVCRFKVVGFKEGVN